MEPVSGLIQAKDGFSTAVDKARAGPFTAWTPTASLTFINRLTEPTGESDFGFVQAADGFLYGTTSEGGLLDFQGGDIFRIERALGALRVMHSFCLTSGPTGSVPAPKLIQGADGALYGVNGGGGSEQDTEPSSGWTCAVPSTCGIGFGESGTDLTRGKLNWHRHAFDARPPREGKVVTLGEGSFQMTIPSR